MNLWLPSMTVRLGRWVTTTLESLSGNFVQIGQVIEVKANKSQAGTNLTKNISSVCSVFCLLGSWVSIDTNLRETFWSVCCYYVCLKFVYWYLLFYFLCQCRRWLHVLMKLRQNLFWAKPAKTDWSLHLTPKESGVINTTFLYELLLLCLLKICLMVSTFLFSMSAQTMITCFDEVSTNSEIVFPYFSYVCSNFLPKFLEKKN